MASVRRKDRSPYYFACYYDEHGNAKCTSTKSKNKKEAQRIAETLEEAWRKKVTTAKAKQALNGILELVGSPPIPTKTLNEVFDDWLREKKSEVSVGTYDQYVSVVKNARTHLGTAAEKDIGEVSRYDLIAGRDSISQAISASAANKMIDLLRMVFKHAVDNELIERSPMLKVNPVSVTSGSKGSRRGLTLDEVRMLLKVAPPLWRGLIIAGLYTGQRLGDVVRLLWGQLSVCPEVGPDHYVIAVRTRKTRRDVRVAAAGPLRKYLLSIRPEGAKPDDPMFPEGLKLLDEKGRVQRLSNKFYDLLVKAGLAEKRSKRNTGNGHGRGRRVNTLSYHCLRHTATTLLKSAGVAQAVVMDIIGHESPEISAVYTHIDDGAKFRAVGEIEDVTE